MARPSVAHGGFLIPNAGSVSDPVLAEPDRVDFNTLANARWGVLSGCLVAGQGPSTISVQAGTAMVNGKFVAVQAKPNMQVQIPAGAAKFDLVVVDDNGIPYILAGKESASPVLPDPPVNATVLAAIYCKTGAVLNDNVVDKRKFLQPALLTQIGAGADLVRNYDSPGVDVSSPPNDFYRVLGDGTTTWANDTMASRVAPGKLKIEKDLEVERDFSSVTVSATSVTATGSVTGHNLRRSTGLPVGAPSPGDLWQDPTDSTDGSGGRVYIGRKQADTTVVWDQILTLGAMFPVGSIIQSLESPTKMAEAGWLLMDGNTRVDETVFPNIFKLATLAHLFSGVAPNRTMILPDMTKRFLMGETDETKVGRLGPTIAGQGVRARNEITITSPDQLPQHGHNVKMVKAAGYQQVVDMPLSGAHQNTVGKNKHNHDVSDPGHRHIATVVFVAGAYDTAQGRPGEQRVLAPFVTGSPRSTAAVGEAFTYVSTQLTEHDHSTGGGAHDHTSISISAVAAHDHGLTQETVGYSDPIDITPNYLAVFVYIRS